MSDTQLSLKRIGPRLVLVAAVLGMLVTLAEAQTLTVLHSFTGGADSVGTNSDLVRDPKGNLYGGSVYGGAAGGGIIFEVTPTGTETVLYTFTGGDDGANPSADLLRDPKGNLYGTTYSGGSNGCGTVFELTPTGTKKILYNFACGVDGANPYTGLVRDPQGNLYGAMGSGGDSGYGTVYKVIPTGTKTVLYNFTGGADPAPGSQDALVRDPQGNLYGTTQSGGAYGGGTVFKVTPTGTNTVLYSFTGGADGGYPIAGLIRDPKGSLYGTTLVGGASGYGTVFEVSSTGTETVLYSFTGDGADGIYPNAGLIRDPQGNLYGTTVYGGTYGHGTVFKVTRTGTETVLHSFTGGTDGSDPIAGLVRDPQGNLYGVTSSGGDYGYGTVYKLIP